MSMEDVTKQISPKIIQADQGEIDSDGVTLASLYQRKAELKAQMDELYRQQRAGHTQVNRHGGIYATMCIMYIPPRMYIHSATYLRRC